MFLTFTVVPEDSMDPPKENIGPISDKGLQTRALRDEHGPEPRDFECWTTIMMEVSLNFIRHRLRREYQEK
jgi:hypothetical protein